jgi:hypothetical protein
LGSFRTAGEPYAAALKGMIAFIADGPEGLLVLDVADPKAIKAVGAASIEGFANGIAVDGTIAYVSDESYGLRMFDIGDPAAPKLVGGFRTPGEPATVRVSDGLIILPDSFSLFLFK